jgi:hypothetical protein
LESRDNSRREKGEGRREKGEGRGERGEEIRDRESRRRYRFLRILGMIFVISKYTIVK